MTVAIRVLGGFVVTVDGVPVPEEAWSRRQAASVVKLLALTPGHRLHREQVMEALWPGLDPASAGPRLHKAAHYARKALGSGGRLLALRQEVVALGDVVRVDFDEFEEIGRSALAGSDEDQVSAALALHGGTLLPDDLYEPWSEPARDRAHVLHLQLLRQARRWEDLLQLEPADEQAHLELATASADRGDLRAALRQLERLDQALRHELGTAPGPEAERLRARLEAAASSGVGGPGPATGGAAGRLAENAHRLFGRRPVGDRLRRQFDEAANGHGSTVVVTGVPGVGKTAVLDLAEGLARQRGWRIGRGSASAMEGPWPYAPVLEALSDLCRRHPALLDGLGELYRQEIDRALSGRDVSWSGESGHQRLFVAAAELLRLASAGHGLLLVVDDLHEADEASLRLLHYLSRCAVGESAVLALALRPATTAAAARVVESLVARGTGTRLELGALSPAATRRMLADRFPELADPDADRIVEVSGGLPFAALELGRSKTEGTRGLLPPLPEAVLRTFERVALLGTMFTTDELLAVADTDEDETYRQLEAALAARVVEPADPGFRFRHALVREALIEQMAPHARAAAHHRVADRLADLGAPPGRVAHQYLAAGLPSRAVPFVVRAVESAGALGAYRDALTLIDGVRGHVSAGEAPRLLARRGDLLLALGDPEAIDAYREAVAVTTGTANRLARARLARAAGFAGDLDTARAALAGMSFEGDAADSSILLAQGNLAYFSGDIDAAWDVAARARELLQAPDDPWHLVDLVSLQGLIAHQRGEWFERFRSELRRTQGKERLATALFDAHLCVAEYLLYGPVPYPEVIAETEELRRRAARAGALRGVAFATALIGEAALLMGDLERADRELTEALDLHRDIDAPAGEAHCLQRLAEVRLARGEREEAGRLLARALPLGRFTVIGLHLLQRVYGSMIAAAPDADAARGVVDQAVATMGETDHCPFCDVMLAVPAAMACADVGDVDDARRWLAAAEESAARWEGSAWAAAVAEARAHVAAAEGRPDDTAALLREAQSLYAAAGQPLHAARCGAFSTVTEPVIG
ncbi:MAG: AAA family ATPase [Nocardioides sp.]